MDNPSVNPSARVARLSAPAASPGSCGMCGKPSHDKGFADPRLDYEFYGSLIFCADCTGDLASVFGYLSPEAYADLESKVAAQDAELAMLRKAILGLESAVDGLSGYRAAYGEPSGFEPEPASVVVVSDDEPEPLITEQDEPEPDSVPVELTDDGAAENGDVNEPAAEQGPDDVRDVTGADVDELLNL